MCSSDLVGQASAGTPDSRELAVTPARASVDTQASPASVEHLVSVAIRASPEFRAIRDRAYRDSLASRVSADIAALESRVTQASVEFLATLAQACRAIQALAFLGTAVSLEYLATAVPA